MKMTNYRDPGLLYFCLVVAFASVYIAVGSRSRHGTPRHYSRIQRICQSLENVDTLKKSLCKIPNSAVPVMTERKFVGLWYSDEERANAKTAERKCPDFTREYLRSHRDDLKMRSISPFGPITDINRFRVPRMIIHQACLCQHCFNITTLEPNPNLASYNITTKIEVAYNNGTKSPYDLITGCTCVVPSYQSASM